MNIAEKLRKWLEPCLYERRNLKLQCARDVLTAITILYQKEELPNEIKKIYYEAIDIEEEVIEDMYLQPPEWE